MKRIRGAVHLAAASVFLAGTGAFAEQPSGPVLVDNDLRGVYWSTVRTNAVDLQWDWCAGASYATLDIAGMNSSIATNFTAGTSNWVWQAFASDVPAAEDIYVLTLTFYTDSIHGAVVGALTSRLAVVTGAFGETAVNAVSNSPAWQKVKTNAVIPYDASWLASATNASGSQLVIAKAGGTAETNALPNAAGYAGWKLTGGNWGYGTFNLALTFPGAEGGFDAALLRSPDGFMFSVR